MKCFKFLPVAGKTATVQWHEKLNIRELHQCALCVTLFPTNPRMDWILQKNCTKVARKKSVCNVDTSSNVHNCTCWHAGYCLQRFLCDKYPIRNRKSSSESSFSWYWKVHGWSSSLHKFMQDLSLLSMHYLSVQRVHALCQEWYASSCILFKICLKHMPQTTCSGKPRICGVEGLQHVPVWM